MYTNEVHGMNPEGPQIMQHSSLYHNEQLINFTVTDLTCSSPKDILNSVTAAIPPEFSDSHEEVFINFSVARSANNSNDSLELFPFLRQPVHMVVILSLAYAAVFLCAVLGNVCVLCVLLRDRRFHSATYYLMANLAVADFIVAIVCQPITLVFSLINGWQFGAFMCKATPYLQGVAVCASVNTLVVIAVDRYVAICHVMRQRNTKRMARVILFLIWFLALLLMTPWAMYYKLTEYNNSLQTIDVCMENFPEKVYEKAFFLGVIFLMCYAMPLVFIVACYSMICYRVWHRNAPGITSSRGVIERSKVRVLKMLIVVVLLFMFSWMPLYITRLTVLFNEHISQEEHAVINEIVYPFAQWLGTSNSCMNPLVYCFFSQKIRSRIRAMLCCSKPEARSLYSCRSIYNSSLEPPSSIRQSRYKIDGFANGYSRCGHYHNEGTLYHHRSSRLEALRSSRAETPRSVRLEGETSQLQQNNIRSTHV